MANHEEENQKIFYDGQIFDAFSFLTDIIGHAKKEIVLIDGYIDVITLNILAKKNSGVDVLLQIRFNWANCQAKCNTFEK